MHFLMMPFVFILQCWVFSWANFLFGAPIIDKTVGKITTLIYRRFHFSSRTPREMLKYLSTYALFDFPSLKV